MYYYIKFAIDYYPIQEGVAMLLARILLKSLHATEHGDKVRQNGPLGSTGTNADFIFRLLHSHAYNSNKRSFILLL